MRFTHIYKEENKSRIVLRYLTDRVGGINRKGRPKYVVFSDVVTSEEPVLRSLD